jgi:hypothetical protein
MADSWRTSQTRREQQESQAAVKADRKMHENGPWDADGNLRMPDWMQNYPPMPDTWPVEYFWMRIGKMTLDRERA